MLDTNCPNCGAPINGHVCEYCGTRFPFLLGSENEGYMRSSAYIPWVGYSVSTYMGNPISRQEYMRLLSGEQTNMMGMVI